jgi:FkbM family methyltransferase
MLDQPSRDLLLDLLAYRVLGDRHVTFPLNTPEYWELFLSVNRERLRQPQTAVVAGLTLGLYEAPGRQGPMLVEAHPWGILNNFLVEQYAYRKATPAVRVRPGDFVIDGGGCWGDTALYFADQVGPAGRVYCWEFWDENLAVLRRNLDRNPRLAANIELVAHALWDRSDATLSFRGNGAATTVAAGSPGDGRAGIATLTIDDLVARRALPRVDFIKLDIEGAELPALRGAVQTLRRFRPTLAIAAYHRPDDLLVLPRLLDGLDLGYRYYLDHFTVQGGETVLFAIAGG